MAIFWDVASCSRVEIHRPYTTEMAPKISHLMIQVSRQISFGGCTASMFRVQE
jgi:hypothetical protein